MRWPVGLLVAVLPSASGFCSAGAGTGAGNLASYRRCRSLACSPGLLVRT
jgi:hypothetical protein